MSTQQKISAAAMGRAVAPAGMVRADKHAGLNEPHHRGSDGVPEAALAYAAADFPVFPVDVHFRSGGAPGSRVPGSRGLTYPTGRRARRPTSPSSSAGGSAGRQPRSAFRRAPLPACRFLISMSASRAAGGSEWRVFRKWTSTFLVGSSRPARQEERISISATSMASAMRVPGLVGCQA